jgi:PKHD-type hydroxylase
MGTKTNIEIAIYPRALPSEMCDRICEMGDNLIQNPGEVLDDGIVHVDKIERHDLIAWFPKGPNCQWLYKEMTDILEQLNKQHWQFELKSVETIQYSQYGPDCHFDWHVDWVPTNDDLDGGAGQRRVSLSVQLSDPDNYTGGYFEIAQKQNSEKPEFYDVDLLIAGDPRRKFAESARPKGSIVAFPSNLWHRVTPVHSGVRCSLVTWGIQS